MSEQFDYGLVRTSKLHCHLGVSRATVYNWINSGLIPKPICIGTGFSGLPTHELKAYVLRLGACTSDNDIKIMVAEIHRQRNQYEQQKSA